MSNNVPVTCRSLSFAYGENKVLERVEFKAAPGDFVAVIGPNGAGKSTLLKMLSGFLAPDEGAVGFSDRPVASLAGRERAATVGYLPQSVQTYFPFTCQEMVAMGAGSRGGTRTAEARRTAEALEATGMTRFANRPFPHLSGGEQKLVLLAKMFAQDPAVLLLDEPIGSLDAGHALAVMKLLARRARSGRTVIAVMHDLNQSLAFCNRFLLLKEGRQLVFGDYVALLAEDHLHDAYGVSFTQTTHPDSEIVFLLPDHQ
jgi:iron complex transport system ATP-binding protein